MRKLFAKDRFFRVFPVFVGQVLKFHIVSSRLISSCIVTSYKKTLSAVLRDAVRKGRARHAAWQVSIFERVKITAHYVSMCMYVHLRSKHDHSIAFACMSVSLARLRRGAYREENKFHFLVEKFIGRKRRVAILRAWHRFWRSNFLKICF